MLVNAGYKVKVLNTINFNKSMRYNPFAYIRSEKDILKLVNTIMVNTKGEGAQATEDFWSKAERLLFTAYIGYIWYESVENKPLAKVEELEEGNYNKIDGLIDTSEKHNKKENEAKHVRISIRDKMAEKKEEMEKRKKQKECEAVKGKTIGSSHIVGSFSKNDMLQ